MTWLIWKKGENEVFETDGTDSQVVDYASTVREARDIAEEKDMKLVIN